MSSQQDDPHLWLEEVEGHDALEWVKERNQKSTGLLMGDPLYAQIHSEVRSILVAKDRIPMPTRRGRYVYNFWQDAEHVKGLWRRTSHEEYAKAAPEWETVLDLDELSKRDGESWVWKGSTCLPPEYDRCLLSLSRGGKDAVVVREFDTRAKAFVSGGFELPEAKCHVAWMDADTIWVGTDFGPGSMTSSGYPRIAKLWKRGTQLSEAKQVFEGLVSDVSAEGYTSFEAGHASVHVLSRAPSFFESETSLYLAATGEVRKVPLPHDADFQGVYGKHLLVKLRSDWKSENGSFKSGALISIPVRDIESGAAKLKIQTVYAPDDRSMLAGVAIAKDALYLSVLQNVQGRIYQVHHISSKSGDVWKKTRVALPDHGTVSVLPTDPFAPGIFVQYESFLVPPTLYACAQGTKPQAIKSLPARFDASPYTVVQYESVSKDGTKIPYFLVHKKDMPLDKNRPTLLYGYGGFEVPMVPHYSGGLGKGWLERGGVYALANIRGGGEFGPKWHQAALLDKRQTAYDDFISVGADLIRRHVTRQEKLGIMGGSNGGLLMGAMLTQRPDLFKAIVCQVPLLDMLRYHKLLAGASWMGEYGNPDDPAMREVISKYSPYQNVRKGRKYPRVFFGTSTKDDRVHPGHARKMVARMEEQGHPVLYYENIEGGHSAAADLEQAARRVALEYAYLWGELGRE